MFRKIIFALLVSTMLIGCTVLNRGFNVNGLVSPTYSPKETFIVKSGNPNILDSDLRFLKYKSQLAKALINAGFKPSVDETSAEMIMLFGYGISDSITRDTSVGDIKATKTDYYRYLDVIAIDARTFNESQEKKVMWSTHVKSQARSNDLNEAIPQMLVAAINYFGKNTETDINVQIDNDDARIYKLTEN